jgi:hypothetical protein
MDVPFWRVAAGLWGNYKPVVRLAMMLYAVGVYIAFSGDANAPGS